jgi:hypothetical protein
MVARQLPLSDLEATATRPNHCPFDFVYYKVVHRRRQLETGRRPIGRRELKESTMSRHVKTNGLVALLLVTVLANSVIGQEEPPAPPAAEKNELREQTIYIPFTKLRDVFEKQGRGVFLPYEKFQELWKQAQAAQRKPAEQKAPAAALISEIDSEAVVSDDVVTVTAKLTLEILEDGWHQIPLRLNGAAILSAKTGDDLARVIPSKQGYRLLVHKTEEQAERREVTIVYAKMITKTPGQNRVSFQAPQAPVNRWRVRVPEQGVKLNIQPLIAASEPPADERAEGETVLLAFVGAAPTVTVDWTPKAEGAAGLDALASVQAEQSLTIGEGVIRSRAILNYTIRRAELTELAIQVPADHKVVGVFDANVRKWSAANNADDEKLQTVSVELFQPVRARQSLTVELEKFVEDAQGEFSAPVIQALNVGRQQGVVAVTASADLRVEPMRRTGLLQLDAGELPASMKKTKWAFSYRYAAAPFDLALRVERIRPRIETRELVEAYLDPDRLTVDLLAVFEIERVGVFQMKFDIPDGYELRSVQGRQAAGAGAVAVDGYHVEGEDEKTLVVNLSQRALGKVALLIEMQKQLDDANLLSPTGESSDIVIPAPRVTPEGVEHSRRRMVVYAPESLRVNPGETEDAQPVSFQEAVAETQSMRENRFSTARQVLAYTYGRDVGAVAVVAQRRRPHVTVAQVLHASIDEGVAAYRAIFQYDIRYSGVKTLRIDVPTDLAAELGNQSGNGRAVDPAPDDVAEGYIAWQLTDEAEMIGSRQFEFRWERKIDALEVGKSVDLTLPVLKPQNVDRAWGQIILAKAESLDIQASGENKGLRPIDPQHDLTPFTPQDVRDTAARAFEFHQDWNLEIAATRYELEEVKRTSIEVAVVRMVVTRSDQIAVQALYRMRSVRQRLVVRLPETVDPKNAFDAQPLHINGQPVALERGDKGEYYIPLTGLSSGEPFVLELRYLASGGAQDLHLPEFPSEPAVQKVYLCVYLPEEWLMLGKQGDWTNEVFNGFQSLLGGDAAYATSDDHLIRQVVEGVRWSESSKFATDGNLYIFSALRPDPPPDGSLSLTAYRDTFVYGCLYLLIAIVGLCLLPRPLTEKFTGLAIVLAALLLAGGLWPLFTSQIFNGRLATAFCVVVFVWIVHFLFVQFRALRRRLVSVTPFQSNTPPVVRPAPPEQPSDAEVVMGDAAGGSNTSDSDSSEQEGESHA